ncbi:MAG TPA: alanine racemase [Bacteroidales bacterium]|nr:alanine racemase [Bacteroidales bacterium]
MIRNIKSPTLVLDVSKALENIRFMHEKALSHGVLFRPHFKTHQSGAIGEWFRYRGISAITVSSVDMALYFASHGWDDISIAFPLNIRDMASINHLASRIRLTVLVDNHSQVEALRKLLHHPLNVMVELDTGHGRSGLAAGDTASISQLAAALELLPHVQLTGLLTHAGHTYQAKGITDITAIAQQAYDCMSAVRQILGNEELLLSWGDTPSCSALGQLPPFDEWRPGNFVFYDLMQYHIGACSIDQIAVALFCPVVAVYPERGQMVVHAGAVHLSKDFIAAEGDLRNYGYVVEPQNDGWSTPIAGAWLASVSQEHGVVQFLPGMHIPFSPGDLAGILPIHSCLTAEAMGGFLTLKGEAIPMFRKKAY